MLCWCVCAFRKSSQKWIFIGSYKWLWMCWKSFSTATLRLMLSKGAHSEASVAWCCCCQMCLCAYVCMGEFVCLSIYCVHCAKARGVPCGSRCVPRGARSPAGGSYLCVGVYACACTHMRPSAMVWQTFEANVTFWFSEIVYVWSVCECVSSHQKKRIWKVNVILWCKASHCLTSASINILTVANMRKQGQCFTLKSSQWELKKEPRPRSQRKSKKMINLFCDCVWYVHLCLLVVAGGVFMLLFCVCACDYLHDHKANLAADHQLTICYLQSMQRECVHCTRTRTPVNPFCFVCALMHHADLLD